MKYRAGFVSNSSSSSFVINFPKDPSDIDNLREMMGECFPRYSYGDKQITTEEVIQAVHNRVGCSQHRKPTDIDKYLVENLTDYVLNNYELEEYNLDFELQPEQRKILEEKMKDFLETLKSFDEVEGSYRQTFTFSDDCGSFEASLMHGDIFRHVDHRSTGRR